MNQMDLLCVSLKAFTSNVILNRKSASEKNSMKDVIYGLFFFYYYFNNTLCILTHIHKQRNMKQFEFMYIDNCHANKNILRKGTLGRIYFLGTVCANTPGEMKAILSTSNSAQTAV